MNKALKYFLYIFLFTVLTVLTQIGGIALVMGIYASQHLRFRFNLLVLTIAIYLILTFVITPITAPIFGREKVRNTDQIKPTSFITVLLNRNYVRPELNDLLLTASERLPSGYEIRYLDASFPFINKFLLLPHLSHNDGRKIDISLMYQTSNGKLTNLKPSISGYGVFVEPTAVEFDQTMACKQLGYFQYDFPKYLTFGTINPNIQFSKEHTRSLINALLQSSQLQKLFIEKHLINRMHLTDARIRFQGCQAV